MNVKTIFNHELSLDEIKQTELNILKHFKGYCEENNISFFLSNGTLLGAVKYGGFVPWDDDIDVFVPRVDYNKLIHNYKNTGKYKLFSYEREDKFGFPYAKLCDITTLKVEYGVDNGIELGLDIDIFPLDYWGEDKKQAKKKLRKMQNNLLKLNLSKIEFSKGKNLPRTLMKWLAIRFCRKKGSMYYIGKMIDEAKSIKRQKDGYLGCVVWPIYGEKEIISSYVFKEKQEVEFENDRFPIPKGYDEYLWSLYGNYKLDPPIDKQVTHHNFKAYR